MGNGACTLILLDLHYSKVIETAVPNSYLTPLAKAKELTTKSWLLAYEAGRRQWLGNSDVDFIEKHPFLGPLLKADVEFYDEDFRLSPIFKFKQDEPEGFDFDTDEDIDEAFEFDEMDEEYFDSDEEDEDDEEDGKQDKDEDKDEEEKDAVGKDYADDL